MRPSPTPNGSEVEPAGPDDLLADVRGSIRDFLGQPDIEADLVRGRLRTGLVSFADSGRRIVGLSTNPNAVSTGLNRLQGGGFSKIDLGLRVAEQELLGSAYARRGEEDRVKLLFVYSDGKFCPRDIARGGNSRDEIHIISIGVGRDYDRGNMQQLASQREYVLEIGDLRELTRIYTDLLPASRAVLMDTLIVTDVLSADMMLVPDSANPAPSSITGQTLEWTFSPATTPFTITYSVQPQAGGILPVSDSALAAWTDSEGLVGSGVFPPVEIEVLLPTPTVTATPTTTSTPTATATPEPAPRYLPFLANRYPEVLPTATPECVPSERTVDVVLVVDTSTSMGDTTETGGVTKLEAAIDAGLGLVDLLKFPPDGSLDQAAVVSFNENPVLVTPLSGDAAAVRAGLNELRNLQSVGTRIDRGLTTGFEEINGSRHRSRNNRAIILVTDGRQSAAGTEDDVLAISQAIKDQGITLWTVGLGADADVTLLAQAASSPDHFKHAPSAEGLRLIYEEIARVVPCR